MLNRDSLIHHLHQENSRQRQSLQRILNDHQQAVTELRNRILDLESTLASKVNTQTKQHFIFKCQYRIFF